jgi:uncharacterized protein YbjT (DUF2867 family)
MPKILVIGATGMLGRPVVRRLVKEGFSVRAMARNIDKAHKMLPKEVEIVFGDLTEVTHIISALEGVAAVYINLATDNPKVRFKPELHGTLNVIEALKNDREILISKLSTLGVGLGFNYGDWRDKRQAEEAIIQSGHPYLIFRASWFMESLPTFLRGDKFAIFGRQPHLWRWLAGDDYGLMLTYALKKGLKNRIFYAQGWINLRWDEVGKEFCRAYKPEAKIVHYPLFMVKLLSYFDPALISVYQLLCEMNAGPEKFMGEETWNELHRPEMTIADYVEYMRETGDIPDKSRK